MDSICLNVRDKGINFPALVPVALISGRVFCAQLFKINDIVS